MDFFQRGEPGKRQVGLLAGGFPDYGGDWCRVRARDVFDRLQPSSGPESEMSRLTHNDYLQQASDRESSAD
jgi:hypothetical protein